jgi:hypothetical protein
MVDWHLPLVIAAGVFGAFMLWRVRPAAFNLGPPAGRGALREARKRIEAAKDDVTRAVALCDAGDAAASTVAGGGGAVGFYLRALRTDPRSVAVVDRAAATFARRPRALESLLWRKLSSDPWTGATRDPARAALKHLVVLYDRRRRTSIRARALEHAIAELGQAPPPSPTGHSSDGSAVA